MTLRTILLLVTLGLLAPAPADAAPRRSVGQYKMHTKAGAKISKKQLQIERHEWMAQYYLIRANDLKGAAKEYEAIVRLDPANATAALALASLYLRDKNDKKALAVLARVTKKNPKNAGAWLALAEVQASKGDDKGVKASLAKAIAADPANVEAYETAFLHAQRRHRNGDAAAKAETLEYANKVVALSRYKGPAYHLAERAVVELSGDPVQLTIYDAKRAYASAFDSPVIGRINQQMNAARQGFEECVKQDAKNEDCHYYLGLVYASVKSSDAYDPKKALAEFALAPSKPLAWVESARIHRANDRHPEARAALEKAIALDANLPVAYVELGIIDKLAGKTDQAVNRFVAAVDLDPFGAVGSRAITELTKVKPTHPYVTQGVLMGKQGDVFSTDRYQSVVGLIEQELGGVEAAAPEQAVLEDIVRKLAEGSSIKRQFKVQLVASKQVNAFALADGRVYVTRGLLDMMKKKFPNRAIDAKNDILGHILAHELAHVVRAHTMRTAVFQEAIKDASRYLDPAVLTHVTRLHEIDADREGIVMAFLAGFHPRGGIEFMEVMGKEMEIPKHLDHPTFEERVEYLTDYWTNDVRYAFVAFKLGVGALDRGTKLEATDMQKAIAAYEEAAEHFKKTRSVLPTMKEAMNDLGIAYAKIGVLAMSKESPLGRWQTRYSVERDSAMKYVNLARDEETTATRGTVKVRIPWQLREAIAAYKEALAADENYGKARLNLAAAYVAANQLDNARAMLEKLDAKQGVAAADIELIRGIVLAESRDYVKAKAAFEKAIASPQAKRAASYNLARTLELAGDKPAAKAAFLQYAKLYPGGPWAKAATGAAAKL